MAMDMTLPGAPPPAPGGDEPESGDEASGEQALAAASCALELAAGSPEAMAAAADAEDFMISFDGDGNALVTIGDVEVNVTADQIAEHIDEETAEIETIEGAAPPA